jgi:hypothetical protein
MQCVREDKKLYASVGEARRAIRAIKRKGGAPDLRVYSCADHWHITRQPDASSKFAPPTSAGPKPYQPSLRKLRAWIEAQQRTIDAQRRRLDAAEAKHAAEQDRARQREAVRLAAHREELAAITAMTDRIRRF